MKGGTLSAFWKSSLLQNIKKIEGDIKKIREFFWKNFRKNEKWEFWNSLTVPKTREGGPFGLFETSVCCKISKNLKGDRLATKEKFENFLKKIQKNEKWEFWKSHSAEKLERGGPLGFLKLQFAAKYQKTWRGDKRIFEKKVAQCRKKIQRGDPVVPSGFVSYVKNWVHERGDPLQ